jgi:hypothetical protein
MLYSASQKGFYSPEIHGKNIPADAVQISAEYHCELLAGQAAGKVIAADEAGYPVAVDPVFPPATVADVKEEARRRIEATGLPWMVQREVSGGAAIPQDVKDACAAIRTASDMIEIMEPIPDDFMDDKYWMV